MLVPTTCFNCESACGLLAYVDPGTLTVRKFEGNPEHPGSRGRNCAKGPATINQVTDPDRVLYPLRRAGALYPLIAANLTILTFGQLCAEAMIQTRQRLVSHRRADARPRAGMCTQQGLGPTRLGVRVILDHGDHYYTLMGDLASIDVRVGDDLSAGAKVGTVGRAATADSSKTGGSELYFEVRHGSTTVEPGPWLGLGS